MRDCVNGLRGEIERVGTMVGDKALGGGHSGSGAKTKVTIGFNLKGGCGEGNGVGFCPLGLFNVFDKKI